MPSPRLWTEAAIVQAVTQFYALHQRWPERHDFVTSPLLPSLTVVTRRMGTWQEPLRLAQDGQSADTAATET